MRHNTATQQNEQSVTVVVDAVRTANELSLCVAASVILVASTVSERARAIEDWIAVAEVRRCLAFVFRLFTFFAVITRVG